MYHYSSYWRSWSRVLLNNFDGQYVELNLTTGNNIASEWTRVKAETIRKHCTPRDRNDKVVAVLPDDVRKEIIQAVGPVIAERLFTFDYLPLIDWKAWQRLDNGGAAFVGCRIKV
jgi:hypothetical protein